MSLNDWLERYLRYHKFESTEELVDFLKERSLGTTSESELCISSDVYCMLSKNKSLRTKYAGIIIESPGYKKCIWDVSVCERDGEVRVFYEDIKDLEQWEIFKELAEGLFDI